MSPGAGNRGLVTVMLSDRSVCTNAVVFCSIGWRLNHTRPAIASAIRAKAPASASNTRKTPPIAVSPCFGTSTSPFLCRDADGEAFRDLSVNASFSAERWS